MIHVLLGFFVSADPNGTFSLQAQWVASHMCSIFVVVI